jgi:hypothetical protein
LLEIIRNRQLDYPAPLSILLCFVAMLASCSRQRALDTREVLFCVLKPSFYRVLRSLLELVECRNRLPDRPKRLRQAESSTFPY